MSENLKAIIYARVSTQEQNDEGLSIDTQIERARAYSVSQGYEIVDVISDEGYSAKTLDRPGLTKIREKLADKSATILVFFKLDRLTRSILDLGVILDEMGKTGFEIAAVKESLDTSTATGRLQLHIMVSLAQWERETTAERTKEVLDYKKRHGEKCGGKRQFGYSVEEMNGKKLIKPHRGEQNKIKLIQELRQSGMSLPAICKELRRRKIKNASGNTNWQPMVVSRILKREA